MGLCPPSTLEAAADVGFDGDEELDWESEALVFEGGQGWGEKDRVFRVEGDDGGAEGGLVVVVGMGLCGLAGGAVGVEREVVLLLIVRGVCSVAGAVVGWYSGCLGAGA